MTEEEKKKGLARVTPADTNREAFAQAVKLSNEINYTQSNADRVIKDYQDAELAGVMGSLKPAEVKAPVVDEDVPIIDTTKEYEAPTEEMKQFEKEKSEAQAQKEWLDSIYSPADYEADEKKKKAAQWITAAQMLGDSLTALGNSYFTAKGANNMGASQGAAKAAAATYQLEQDIRNAREKAAKAKMEMTMKAWERKFREDEAKRAQGNADRIYELQKNQFELQKQKDETTRNDAMTKWQKEFNLFKKTTEANLEKVYKENKPYRFDAGDSYVDIPREYVNEQSIGAIFDLLPEDIKSQAGRPKYGRDMLGNTVVAGYEHPDLKGMLAAIGMGMDNPKVSKAIKALATGEKVVEIREDFD